jgi:DNA repair exonuclease SbcCD ATPase subunit
LERRHAEGTVLRGQLAEMRTRRDVLLDGRTDNQLAGDLATDVAGRARLLREHPAWADAAPHAAQLLAAAKQLNADFKTQIDLAERRRDDVVRVVTAAKDSLARVKATLHATTLREGDIRRQIGLLTADGLDDTARDNRRGQLSLAWRAACEAVAEIDLQLKEFADKPAEDLERLEYQLEATRSQQSECAARQHQAQGRLEAIQRESPYSALNHTDEQIAVLTARVEAEQQRADAIKLLRDTIHNVRREAVESVARPIEIAATRMLRRIAGGRLGDVRLGDNLAPQGVTPRYAETDVTVDRLSGGEQEQLYFATRLSLAERVAEKQRQLVVFDDVLTATDAGRFARIQAILEESADRLQVLILTCHPERYAGLASSVTWDLEAAIEASRAAVT